MRKIFVFFAIVLSFLFLPILKVDGMTISDVTEIKFYNLIWELTGSWGDTQEYRLSIEVNPGQYQSLNYVASTEVESLNLYGVIVFQYPVFNSHSNDDRTVYYRRNSNSEFQHFKNVEYIALKKLSNKCELYIKDKGVIHTRDFFPGSSDLGGIRMTYYIPDYTYEEGYNEGYNDGYLNGIEAGYRDGEEGGYNIGFDEGYNQGYTDGYDKAYEEIITNDDYTLGYNDGFKAGEKSKIAQNNEAFYKSIEKWLVPAIITVIIVGGIVSIIAIKRREL